MLDSPPVPEFLKTSVRGAVVGATLGAPLRGQATYRKLNFYEPIPVRMAKSEALDAWLVSAEAFAGGAPAAEIPARLAQRWQVRTHETAFGLNNFGRGIAAPMSGRFQNPLATGAQAIGRAALWGILLNGQPEAASEYALADASLDHAGEGCFCSVAVARMAAVAKPGVGIHAVLSAAANGVPPDSQALRVISKILALESGGSDAGAAYAALPPILPTQDPHLAPLNLGFLLLGLLYGKGDFDATIRLVAGCGGSTDQTTLAAGAILGALTGSAPEEWLKPLGEPYVAGVSLRDIEAPDTIERYVDTILSAARIETPRVPEAEVKAAPAVPELSVGEPPEPQQPPAPTPIPKLSERLLSELRSDQDALAFAVNGVCVTATYVNGIVAHPARGTELGLRFENEGTEEITVEPALVAPEGWTTATRLTSFRLRPGEATTFGVVAQPPVERPLEADATLRLDVGQRSLELPLLAPQRWYAVGPFANYEGHGFEKATRAEDVQRLGVYYNGRNDITVRWIETLCGGVLFDVEPLFKEGPGVAYLFARARFAKPGRYRVVAAASTGAIVKIDGRRTVAYYDEHIPIPRAIQPYVGEFQATGVTDVLVKIMRNREQLLPLVLYFLAADGSIARPAEFLEMPP